MSLTQTQSMTTSARASPENYSEEIGTPHQQNFNDRPSAEDKQISTVNAFTTTFNGLAGGTATKTMHTDHLRSRLSSFEKENVEAHQQEFKTWEYRDISALA